DPKSAVGSLLPVSEAVERLRKALERLDRVLRPRQRQPFLASADTTPAPIADPMLTTEDGDGGAGWSFGAGLAVQTPALAEFFGSNHDFSPSRRRLRRVRAASFSSGRAGSRALGSDKLGHSSNTLSSASIIAARV